MPGNNNKKRGGRRRPRKQRKTGMVTIPSSPGVAALPTAMRTKLRYFFVTSNGTGGANQYAEYTFRSNSLYDPDYTGVGVQPAGFAALATLYSRYRVVGATVKFTAVNDAGGSTTVIFYQKDSPTTYSSIIAACTQGFSKRAILSDQSGGKNQHTFNVRIKPWEVLGISKSRYMIDDQFASAVGGSPAIQTYFGLGVHAVTIAASIQMQIDVIYDAILFDRVTLV